MIHLINIAHATASSSADLYNAVVTNTGAIVDDSMPLLYIILGLLIAGFALSAIIWAFRSATSIVARRN